jgi:hypothetical protein
MASLGQPSLPPARRKLQRAGHTTNDPDATPAATELTAPAAANASPSSSPDASPSAMSWDLSDLIDQYHPSSSTSHTVEFVPDCSTTQQRVVHPAPNRHWPRTAAAAVDQDDEAAEDDGEDEDDAPESSSAPRASTAVARPQANKRFFSNLLKSTTLHNERVEHVYSAARGLDGGDSNDAEITVTDPRGQFGPTSAAAAVKSARPAMKAAAGAATHSRLGLANLILHAAVTKKTVRLKGAPEPDLLRAGSLEAEAAKLIDAFEGRTNALATAPTAVDGSPSSVASRPERKVRGRGSIRRGVSDGSSAMMDTDDASALAAPMKRSVSNPSSAVAGASVAKAHLHSDEQRAQYDATHNKYQRARGVILLQHIAKQYGIEILIKPPTSSSSIAAPAAISVDSDERKEHARQLSNEHTVSSPAASSVAPFASPSPSPSPPLTAPRRTFQLGLGAQASLPTPTAAAPAAATSATGRKVLQLKPRTVPLPLPHSTSDPHLSTAAAAKPSVQATKRNFDATISADPTGAVRSPLVEESQAKRPKSIVIRSGGVAAAALGSIGR